MLGLGTTEEEKYSTETAVNNRMKNNYTTGTKRFIISTLMGVELRIYLFVSRCQSFVTVLSVVKYVEMNFVKSPMNLDWIPHKAAANKIVQTDFYGVKDWGEAKSFLRAAQHEKMLQFKHDKPKIVFLELYFSQ